MNRKVLEGIIFQQIKKFENVFIDLQKKRLNQGEDTLGTLLGTYSLATEIIASNEATVKPKKAGEPYNYEYTGSFFRGMKLVFGNSQVIFTSSDSKTELLQLEYENLFGLKTEELQQVISRVIYPAFMIQFRKNLGL